MPVCKFYLQGICKFGNNCNFDHPRDQRNLQPQYRVDNSRGSFQPVDNRHSTGGGSGGSNRFADLISRNAPPTTSSTRAQDGTGLVTDQDFLSFLQREMTSWFESPSSWKLSCFTYSQKAPNLPILEDISPEEVRFGFYDARKRNTLNEFIAQFNQKYKHNIEIISQLANPNYETKQFLLKYFHECEQKSPVKSTTPTKTIQAASTNPFMQIVQQKQQQQTNMFSQQPQQSMSPAFQAPSFTSTLSPTQPPMQFQSGFGNNTGANFNQFNNLSNLKPGGFNWSSQQQNTQQSDMNSSMNNGNMSFQSIQPISQQVTTQPVGGFNQFQPTNLFNTNKPSSTNMFSALVSSTASTVLTKSKIDPNVPLICYSQLDELTPEELNEYKKSSFTLGRLPFNPPARELC